MEAHWLDVLDRGVTALIAIYVIVRLEPRFVELRDAVINLTAYLKNINGGGK